ncbi:hypothetical protein [Janthinobacterium agaricidamnosum]|uniref:MgtC-like C-terminal domain-containing protein n=1 Tax=Janthinobacterium agaricidamnosum NBRC 102515 = DSM 9628 TaxID=1349767 RepID=W0UY85_9BURK|nr:hypothetical protein [Janthinobacterium agaricidamnosum]CDG81514.1 hypothetical protein GJA_857 [Janthinobacterium agaricidamnosum NBRC 102515 = DSM 9628]
MNMLNWIFKRGAKWNLKPSQRRDNNTFGLSAYRLTVTCPSSEADQIVHLLLQELQLVGLSPSQILRVWDDSKSMVKLVALVMCQIAQRIGLVRFVNRAGAMPQVRHVRWEGVAPAA